MAVSVENSRGAPNFPPNFEVLVGTYEEFVLGFKLNKNPEGGWEFVPSFTNHSHCGSIRAVSTTKRFLASGSSDESIRLFSLRDRTEHGYLQQHSGSVTCLEFYKHTHLLSGSDDGTVCVWNARTWNCDKTLVAHKGGVTVLSVHPSGKLALTAGKDRALKTWNLIKGRTAYVTNIKGVPDAVRWAPDGEHYAVAVNNSVHVYQVKTAGVSYTVDFKKRVNFITFTKASELVIGGEAPEVEMHSFVDRKLSTKFTAHEKRVKAACFTSLGSQDQSYLITASNDGFIKMWRLSVDGTEPSLVTQVDTTCRITSMDLWLGKRADSDVKTESATPADGQSSPTQVDRTTAESVDAAPASDRAPPAAKPATKAAKQPTSKPTAKPAAEPSAAEGKPLKPVIKRPASVAKSVDCASGQFIVEPMKPRDEKRKRLTFSESNTESQ